MKNNAFSDTLIIFILIGLFTAGGLGVYLIQNNQDENNLNDNYNQTKNSSYENSKVVIEHLITAINENDAESLQECYSENSKLSQYWVDKILERYEAVNLKNYQVLEENYFENLQKKYKKFQVELGIIENNEESHIVTTTFTTVKEDNKWKITLEGPYECTKCN